MTLPLYTEIAPLLYMGGTHSEDFSGSFSGNQFSAHLEGFEAVVSLELASLPVPASIEERRYGFLDAAMNEVQSKEIEELAQWAHLKWKAGATTLIRCHYGLNRSGLVTALVLMRDGLGVGDAIALIRGKRSSSCLGNRDFVEYLYGR